MKRGKEVFKFAKFVGRCKQDELKEMFSISKEEWLMEGEDKERCVSYEDWIRTIAAVSTMKEDCKNWMNEDEFWVFFNIS